MARLARMFFHQGTQRVECLCLDLSVVLNSGLVRDTTLANCVKP